MIHLCHQGTSKNPMINNALNEILTLKETTLNVLSVGVVGKFNIRINVVNVNV